MKKMLTRIFLTLFLLLLAAPLTLIAAAGPPTTGIFAAAGSVAMFIFRYLLIFVVLGAAAIVGVRQWRKRRRPLFAANRARARLYYRYADVPPSGSLPLNGELAAGYAALCLLGARPDIGGVVSALLDSWAGRGIVQLQKKALRLNRTAGETLTGPERRLFDLLCGAAQQDGMLPYKTWQAWCRMYSPRLDEWALLYYDSGAARLVECALAEIPEGATLRGARLTRAGERTAVSFAALFQFFSMREPDAGRLRGEVWQYLAWAQLLGAARPLRKNLRPLYARANGDGPTPPQALWYTHRLGNATSCAHYHGLLESGAELPKGEGVTSAHERNALVYGFGNRAQNGSTADMGGSYGGAVWR